MQIVSITLYMNKPVNDVSNDTVIASFSFVCHIYIYIYTYSISFLRFTFLEISIVLFLQKNAICLKYYFITHNK